MEKMRDFDNYLIQLIETMRESAQNLPDPNVICEFDEDSLPEELKMFSDVERFLQGKAKPISYITGIETIAFPPRHKLNSAQTTILYSEITRLLRAYGFYADFPEGLPVVNKYDLLIQKWDEHVVYTGTGISGLEFCDYEPTRCPFPESYCQCKYFDDFDDYDIDDIS